MESKPKLITFTSDNPKREVIAYLLPSGKYDVYCEKLLLASSANTEQIALLKAFFNYKPY